jgi:hypothetical protein
MQQRWDLLPPYPAELRSYVNIFTTYTDAAFPSDSPSDYGLRVALRYEVGRFFASVERLKRAIEKQSIDEAYTGKVLYISIIDCYTRFTVLCPFLHTLILAYICFFFLFFPFNDDLHIYNMHHF